jgi:AcrR family transcriptional regulator
VTGGVRRRLPREERRAQLLEVGRRQVERSSLDALSTDEVAAEAGISRGLLFHYFPTRGDFLVALTEAAAEELLELTEPDPDLDRLSRLREGLRAYVDYVAAHRDLYLALIRGAAGGGAAMLEVFERTRGVLADRLIEGLSEDPEGAPSPLRYAARGYVASVEEIVVSWLSDEEGTLVRDDLLALLETTAVSTFAAAGFPIGEGRDAAAV